MENKKSIVYVGYSVVVVALYAFAMYRAMKTQVGLVTTAFITVIITCVFLMGFLLCDGMLRLCQMLVMYAVSGESFWYILRNYFALNIVSATILVVSMLMLSIYSIIERRFLLDYAWDFGSSVCMPLIGLAFCLLRISNLAEWELKSLDLNVVKGLDYGTGMAYSFYYGYLRLILPYTGTATKGIIEKIENFEDNHNVTFPVHKLFILIPSSGYVPPDLKEVSYQWMESVHKLEEEQRSRAGNIGRLYFNNAYKIYPDGRNSNNDPVYVVVEGASPLLTYYEIQVPYETCYKALHWPFLNGRQYNRSLMSRRT
ncbi:stimulator of interferon genes protein isoform X2 [Monomorium pharaonis]|uniref:stimulator of interferon genes protein isoform X2 n=1 Tax=Monomorium pharaonis TaxID=307658 RepID=UPI00063FC620|nr:stimulator of interferon genes protein isoform X2 [Monomorium pharaonis]